MKPFRALAVLATLTLATSALAEVEDPIYGVPYVFVTVDAYSVAHNGMEVTGILQGETTPRVIRFGFEEAARCDRLALLAQSRPGRYRLELTTGLYSFSCKLIRQ